MPPIDPRQLEIASRTDVGRVRNHNEDRCAVFESDDGARLLVVADGMGGHAGGATASRLAVEALGERFAQGGTDLRALLGEAFALANERVHERSLADEGLRGMGTTVVALAVGPGGEAYVAHVGDSRAYRLPAGEDAVLERLTEDHSVVAEMIRRGLLSEAEADDHPRRNEILRSVGVDEHVEVEIAPLQIAPGDRLLLCSDGLCGVLDDVRIARLLAGEPPADAVHTLVRTTNEQGAPDNVTVIVALVRNGESDRDHDAAEGADAEGGAAQEASEARGAGAPPAGSAAARSGARRATAPRLALGLAAAVLTAAGLAIVWRMRA